MGCMQKHGDAGDDECNECKGAAENGSQVMESERANDMFSTYKFHLSDTRLHFRLFWRVSYHIGALSGLKGT